MDDGLPGGWTLDDLTGIARHVARNHRGLILEPEEVRDIAAVAIVERLYTEPAPERVDLYRAAHHAVDAANHKEGSYCGIDMNMSRTGREGVPRRWAAYWHGRSALVSPFEDALVERYAARQVWAALPEKHREVLRALIVGETYEGAQDILGVTRKTWEHRIRKARLQARELWHYPEEPSRHWAPDRPGLGDDAQGRNRGLMGVRRRRRIELKESA